VAGKLNVAVNVDVFRADKVAPDAIPVPVTAWLTITLAVASRCTLDDPITVLPVTVVGQ
jgi:hypothetical protein